MDLLSCAVGVLDPLLTQFSRETDVFFNIAVVSKGPRDSNADILVNMLLAMS